MGGRVSRIARVLQAFSSFCKAVFPGKCSRRNSGAGRRDDQIDWSRAVVDSCSTRAVYGCDQTGPNRTDRAKRGSKRHLICDGRGVPLAVRLTGAKRNDSQEALALVDAIPPLHGERG